MQNVKIITVGSLKETYLKEATAEYSKRLSRFCKLQIIELKESSVPESPSQKEIDSALCEESEKILALVPPQAELIALCVEGKQMSSEQLAERIESSALKTSDLVFVIGSSHGLSEKVKMRADLRLSISMQTFPHQLMRVILLESIYRSYNIINGTKYHK